MPRPRKLRLICRLPQHTRFGPIGCGRSSAAPIAMTVDEYETIRLIDLLEYSQEQCAGQMNVSRTTVQMIYASARKKLALSLTGGLPLNISGGEYCLCEGKSACKMCKNCWKHSDITE